MSETKLKYNDFSDCDRFIVKNYFGENRSSYSTKIPDGNAYIYACECADRERGRVIAETDLPDGTRERRVVHISEGSVEIDERRAKSKKKKKELNQKGKNQ